MINLPWSLLIGIGLFAGGAILGEFDGTNRVNNKWTAKVKKARADGLASARTTEVNRFRNMEVAYRANALEIDKNRAAAARAESAAHRLLGELSTQRLVIASLPEPTVRVALDTSYAVLGECVESYRGMARAADEHAADTKLCLDGWPKK